MIVNNILSISAHNIEMVERLKKMPGVIGIVVHGGFSNNPRHETDASSDLDLTVITDIGCTDNPTDPRKHLPWLNFKSFQALEDSFLEVDIYYFDINDLRPWDNGTREGYAGSATLIYDKDGKAQAWLDSKTELTPESRNNTIIQLLSKAECLFYNERNKSNTQVDERIILSKVVRYLVEIVFYINWEYPPDLKWRVSGSHILEWKPRELITLLGKCNQTVDKETRLISIKNLFTAIRNKLAEEGLTKEIMCQPRTKKAIDNVVQIARLFTRIDKYSAHSIKKCVRRGLPWNGHDLVSEGIDNVVDIIYYINNQPIPDTNKFKHLNELDWKPKEWNRYLYQASTISNYENPDDVLTRADALRQLFISIKGKINELDLFSTSSLYAEDFMNEDLFSENSPYMKVFKSGIYLNRQQVQDTFAEQLYKKVDLPTREKNILFGMCSHYLISTEDEFLELAPENIHPTYLPIWEKVVKQLK